MFHHFTRMDSGSSDLPMTLYTIGHSNLNAEDFLARLQRHKITTLVDVRSAPVSKYVPHFNKSVLESWLPDAGIIYRYAGKYLGGRTENPAYLSDGKPDYLKMMQRPKYVIGIVRLLNLVVQGAESGFIAVMCAENDALQCHRHHLIARSLIDPSVCVIEGGINLTLQHIDASGDLLPPLTPEDFSPPTIQPSLL